MAADTTPKDLNSEEQAAMDAAKRDLEARKAQVGKPVEMYDPLWLLTEPGQAVLATSLGRDPMTRQPYPVTTDKVTAIIPRPVRLTLTHHHVFDLQPGIRELPACLLVHPFLRANGVKSYERAAPAAPPQPPLMGTGRLKDPVRVGDREFPLKNWVVAAFTMSGKSVEEWNALPDEERTGLIQAEIDKAAAAMRVQTADAAEGEAERAGRLPPLRDPRLPPREPEPSGQPGVMTRSEPLGMPGRPQMSAPEVAKVEPDRPRTGPMNTPAKGK